MASSFSPIVLSGNQPIASGGFRVVYQHPLHEDLLIKVPRPDKIVTRWQVKSTWLGRMRFKRRYGIYTDSFRDLREYIAARARLGDHPACLQRPIGFVETDLGLGFAVVKVRGRDGNLAPTLLRVLGKTGLTPELRRQLADLKQEVDRIGVATGDLNSEGILCASSPERGDHMVIVDGLGDKTFLRINTWSRFIRSLTNLRHFKRVEKRAMLANRHFHENGRRTEGP